MTGVTFTSAQGIGTIVLDDAASRNAVNDDIVNRIRAQLTEWSRQPDLRGLVLTGANGAFSSGGRLDMIESKREYARTPGGRAEIAAEMRKNARLVEELRGFPAPTVAAIDGACVGAAIGWACACDLRIASTRAKFLTGFARVGLSTDFGTSRLLAEAVGRGRAASWLLTSPMVNAEEAVAAGLVTSLHAAEELLPAALSLVDGLDGQATVAIRGNLGDSERPLSDALTREADRFAQLL